MRRPTPAPLAGWLTPVLAALLVATGLVGIRVGDSRAGRRSPPLAIAIR